MTSQDAYYSNLNEVNTFVHTYQLKSLDIEEKYIDVSTSVCLKHKEEYIDQIKKNEGLLFLYNNCHRFYTQVLSLEKIELKAFITYLNTTLDDKIFDEFTEILISHYKELYMPKEID